MMLEVSPIGKLAVFAVYDHMYGYPLSGGIQQGRDCTD